MGHLNENTAPRSKYPIGACLIILVTITNAVADTQKVSEPYYSLIYDFEVAQFCGLVSKNVHDAFWAKRKLVEEKSTRSNEQLRQVRISAMAAADIEYANRGLGGYRPWCQNEGREGIERIIGP